MKKLCAIALAIVMIFTMAPLAGGSFTASAKATEPVFDAPAISVSDTGNDGNPPSDDSALVVSSEGSDAMQELYEDYMASRDFNFQCISLQIDWAISDDPNVTDYSTLDWHYDSAWDTRSKKVEYSYYEYLTGYVDSNGSFEEAILEFSVDSAQEWLGSEENPEIGFKSVLDPDCYFFYKKNKTDNYSIAAINYFDYTCYVRARYVASYYPDGSEEECFCASEWSTPATYGGLAEKYTKGNLLVNPDFEVGLTGWTDPKGVWTICKEESGYYPQHGKYMAWPKFYTGKNTGDSVYIYQDVDLTPYEADNTVAFNALVCNYDQYPNDMGRIKLVFYDASGKILKVHKQAQRNPNWLSQTIYASIPEGAVKARAYLYAVSYVGPDVDAYYDYTSLTVRPYHVDPVSMSEQNGKKTAVKGNTLQIIADNGTTTDPSAYEWRSSFDALATVDDTGKVTVLDERISDGVAIYAKDKTSGVTGVYWINNPIGLGKATLSSTTLTFTGKALKPTVKVYDKENTLLKEGTDYTLQYKNNTKIGKASVEITGIGEFEGDSMTKTFTIAKPSPAKPSISKLTAGKKSFTVKWAKKSVTGYEIQYSLKSNMSGAKTVKITSSKTVSKTVKSLKAKKKYYVQIRSYETVAGTKYYSSWSTKKTVTTK